MKTVVLRCPFCEERGHRGAILAKLAVDNGNLELWCRKCRKPIGVEVRDGQIKKIVDIDKEFSC